MLDLKKDFWAVWADFKTYNGIDLTQEDMHWWQFMALFHSLPQGWPDQAKNGNSRDRFSGTFQNEGRKTAQRDPPFAAALCAGR